MALFNSNNKPNPEVGDKILVWWDTEEYDESRKGWIGTILKVKPYRGNLPYVTCIVTVNAAKSKPIDMSFTDTMWYRNGVWVA